MEVVYKLAQTNEEIKNWVEKNGGTPALVDDPSVVMDKVGLRIDWPGKKDEAMLSTARKVTRDTTWENFFWIMEKNGLGFMYAEENDGVNPTWLYKFVNKNEANSETEA